ncbi:MAG: type II toxin-antitoxin system VapC family toxin [Paracoccaceae bacterium]
MALLLDTHAFLWWGQGNVRMPVPIREVIEDPGAEVFVSAATAWEIATKHNLGKLPEAEGIARDISGNLAAHGFRELAITVEHAERAGRLPLHHRDPFDRMLIAQAEVDGHTLISNETLFDRYGITRLW